jgi:hypothetical protein
MKLPKHKLIIGPQQPAKGFIKAVSHNIEFHFDNGEKDSMIVDSLDKKCMDVVVIVPYERDQYGLNIYLRSCIRPSLATREYDVGRPDKHKENPIMWELPAGLVEPEETGMEGIYSAALRELKEETGFIVPSYKIEQLGHPYFSSPGIVSERIYIMLVDVNKCNKIKPTEDGSALEKNAVVESVSLTQAFQMINDGDIVDSKTILSLYRFHMYNLQRYEF